MCLSNLEILDRYHCLLRNSFRKRLNVTATATLRGIARGSDRSIAFASEVWQVTLVSPNRRNITHLVTFLTVLSLFFSIRSNCWTDVHALWLKRRVSAQGWSFWGVRTMGDHIWENMPPTSPPTSKNGRE